MKEKQSQDKQKLSMNSQYSNKSNKRLRKSYENFRTWPWKATICSYPDNSYFYAFQFQYHI